MFVEDLYETLVWLFGLAFAETFKRTENSDQNTLWIKLSRSSASNVMRKMREYTPKIILGYFDTRKELLKPVADRFIARFFNLQFGIEI